MDKPIGNNAWIALAWCTLIALGGYLWSKRLFNREYAR
jgi:ABC-2 type transport system permease protein